MAGKTQAKAEAGVVAAKAGSAKPSPRLAIAPAANAIRQRATHARRHPDAGLPVSSATEAGKDPKTEQTRNASRQTIENLDEAKANEIRRQEFKAKLKEAIDKATPKPTTESQADKVMKSGAADANKTMRQELTTERDAALGPLKTAAKIEASPSAQPKPPETKLQLEQVGPAPQPVSGAAVVPAPLPPERLDYSSDRAPSEQMMAANQVTQEQLQKGNEPAFGPALEARATAEKHEATAAARYRQSESVVQTQTRVQADHTLAQGLRGMQGSRAGKIGRVIGEQLSTKNKNLAERQRITDKINEIKNRTRAEVRGYPR